MEIRMKTLMAGPSGTRHPGEVHDVSAKEAEMLVAGGYADPVSKLDVAAPGGKKKQQPKGGAQQSPLEAAKAAVLTDIAGLESQLAAASDDDKPALAEQLAAKQQELAALTE